MSLTSETEETDATNELIDDISGQEVESNLLTAEEIHGLRTQGVDGAEIIRIQEERHNRFKLKTEFSKEKWRKRKEKKYVL
jgi:tRNA (adenine-N(1)-)-methyltransferase non-catalytic subunit